MYAVDESAESMTTDCRMFQPCVPSSTAYNTKDTELDKQRYSRFSHVALVMYAVDEGLLG